MAAPRTIEQGRAEKAYELAKIGMNAGKDYKNRVKSFPMMVKTNGLGAAVAFAHGKNDWKLIYEQLKSYLKENELYNHYGNISLKDVELDNFLTQVDSSLYRAITNETLALFTWLRRFAEGLDNS